MARTRTLIAVAGGAVAGLAAARVALRHLTHGEGRAVEGGLLVRDTGAYDRMSRFVFGRIFDGIAAEVARVAPSNARVLEVGSGPGLLALRLAARGLDVTAIDLDEAMVERAKANAARGSDAAERRPTFLVGDAAALPFDDASFDVVVSTFSMHHWADPAAGLAEVARVLRKGGRALIWDLRPGGMLSHHDAPDPLVAAEASPMRVVDVAPWRWPGPIALAVRLELLAPERDAEPVPA